MPDPIHLPGDLPIIVTRAQPGAGETVDRLAALGGKPVLSPVLELRRTRIVLPSLEHVQGLIFTSANGVRFFAEAASRRDLTAWCVGPATEAAAQAAGFEDCRNAAGDGDDLAALIIGNARAEDGPLVHVANAAAAGNVKRLLVDAGFEVHFTPLYEAAQAEALTEEAGACLAGDTAAIVLVHSAKGAAAFAALSGSRPLFDHILVAVSARAAAPLAHARFAKVEVATLPNETSLMEAVFRACSGL
ncbi:MAG: uroporphyrinogen-III synthase [Pseudomonadota bacterium]